MRKKVKKENALVWGSASPSKTAEKGPRMNNVGSILPWNKKKRGGGVECSPGVGLGIFRTNH